VLSLVVFFPIVGAGFFGASLHAGPLPALGNLVLHLLYGATLGAVYCLPEVNPAEEQEGDARLRQFENEGIAFGLLGGLAVGLVIGAALSTVISNSQASFSSLLLICGALGCAIGGALGPFIGVDYGERHMAR
jgi:lipoprotein signal peptidase